MGTAIAVAFFGGFAAGIGAVVVAVMWLASTAKRHDDIDESGR